MPDATLPKYMLDTNLFDCVLDGKITIAPDVPLHLLATGVQRAELDACPIPERREKLLTVFDEIGPIVTRTESFAFGIAGAGWNESNWNDSSGRYMRMLNRLQQLDTNKRKRLGLGQDRDILIAETAIKNHVTLVTDDWNLRQVVLEFGGRAIDHLHFEREIAML
jgi:hypothetical protein